MEHKLFKTSDAIRILRINQRSIINWVEKSLVEPVTQARGAGSKREYSYLNLLELALCQHLTDIGLGVYPIKQILANLREKGDLKNWAENFDEFFRPWAKMVKEDIDAARKGEASTSIWFTHKKMKVFSDPQEPTDLDNIIKHIKPKEPIGILIYCYGEEEIYFVSPWDLKTTVDERVLDEISSSDKALIINLGKIKRKIDSRIMDG